MSQGPPVGSLTGVTGSVTDWKLLVSHAVKFDDDSVTAKKRARSVVQTARDEWWRGPDGVSMPCKFISRR